jgi:hemolysin activation/secretion protein
MKKYCLFLLFLPLMAFADSDYPLLKGVLLTNQRDDSVKAFQGVQIKGVSGDEKLLNDLMTSHFGNPLTEGEISCIKKEVLGYYQGEDRCALTVIAPCQDLTNGVLTLIVIESKLGGIRVTGNRHFSSEQFCKAISLQPDQPISRKQLVKEVQWLNENPFRKVDVVYAPGTAFGTTDIELVVNDRRTIRFYSGFDNTGNDTTGNNRIYAGFNWGDVFGLDHIFSYQFTTAPEYNRFWAHTGTYTIPLPWYNTLIFFGGYSQIHAKFRSFEAPAEIFSNKGASWQVSARYDIPLPLFTFALHEFTLGYDFKNTNSNLFFGAIPVNPNPTHVNLGQFMASYNIGYESKDIYTSFELEGFWSPGEWYPNQTNADYQELRLKAKNKYIYARSSFSFIWDFSSPFTFFSALRGQIANRNLLPSEEFGVGGYDTVRGYKEREVNGDDAFVMNLELQTKPRGFGEIFRKVKWIDDLILIAFFDYGMAIKNQTAFGQKKTDYLYSVGPGVKYQMFPYLNARLFYGIQLNDLGFGGPHNRIHFQIVGSF